MERERLIPIHIYIIYIYIVYRECMTKRARVIRRVIRGVISSESIRDNYYKRVLYSCSHVPM